MIQHRSPISGIAVFEDRFVATAGYDNQVILWDQPSRRPLARVLHDHLANQCAFNAQGTRLVTSSSDHTTRLWSVPELRLLAVLNDQQDDVEMSVFHPAKELVATASRDHRMRVYDLSGRLLHTFTGHTADVISVDWASDSDELVTSSDDGTVKRWSLATASLVEDIDLGGIETDTVAISPTGTVYAGNDEGQLLVLREGARQVIPAHRAGIKRLVLGTDRGLLVTLSYDRTLCLWDVSGPAPSRVDQSALPDDVWPRSCAFATGSTLVFGTFGATYRTYDYRERRWRDEEVPPTPGVNAACVHDGAVLSVGDAGVVWRDGVEQARTGSLCNFLTPAAGLVVTGGQLGRLFDALTGRVLHQHRSPLNCGARLRREGIEHVIVGAYTGEGIVLRLAAGGTVEHVGDLRFHHNAVKGVAVSGDLIFSVCADGSAAWQSVTTLQTVHTLARAHDRIANGCAALDGGRFASVSRDLKLRLWEPDFRVRVLDTPHTHSIKCVAADGEGRFVATGSYDGHVAVHDRATGTWPTVVRPSAAGISSLAHDAARRVFLASCYDGSVYEVAAGDPR
jgi:toxoflavin biosynthesis protein ToxC